MNFLQKNRAEKVRGKRGRGKKNYQVMLSMKKYLRRRSSQIHGSNVTIWLNHRITRAAMKKKMMVLRAKFPISPG